jgi:hypothetical protein
MCIFLSLIYKLTTYAQSVCDILVYQFMHNYQYAVVSFKTENYFLDPLGSQICRIDIA